MGVTLGWACGLVLVAVVRSQLESELTPPRWRRLCPQLVPHALIGYTPRGEDKAGVYTKSPTTSTDLVTCVDQCCAEESCNIVFLYDNKCFKLQCESDELCEPVYKTDRSKFGGHVMMVLIRPVLPGVSWSDVLQLSDLLDDMAMSDSSKVERRACDLSQLKCPVHEVCDPQFNLCTCVPGFTRDTNTGSCIIGNMTGMPALLQSPSLHSTELPSPPLPPTNKVGGDEASTKGALTKLIISVLSKSVRLPENAATLSAYTVPAEQPGGEHYSYEWKLLSQPDGSSSGTMTDQNSSELKLSNLSEGLYMFRVGVSSQTASGQAFANVTVLPRKRINSAPVAVIQPASLTIKLPNTGAVLDGSPSHDDDAITSWKWELQQGPLGYQPQLIDTPTLQLTNLQIPGNYTFKLTVEDSDKASNSTTANITVLKAPDYPPEANAGPDQILYLPHNSLTLNGSLSTDDRGIKVWEWTKTDQDKAVDMQNTHTPLLNLSNLEIGTYTFVLKVTDESDQSSTSEVHVFVFPPTNNPPIAKAGPNVSVALPQTWVILNGSGSSDDIGIISWKWQQISGPSKVVVVPSNGSVANASALTKGEYKLQLTVSDSNGNSASDMLTITVTQNHNAAPRANAGGDRTLALPVGVLVINGSGSSDDLGIAKWHWTREPTSLAMGTVVTGSDTSPALMVVNVVPGRYVFRLRVTDDQGEWNEDTVSIIVKQDPHLFELVELTLNVESVKLTKAQSDSVILKLGLLLHDAANLIVRELRPEVATGRAVIVFYVATGKGAMPGPVVVTTLTNKLAQDSLLLHLSVARIQTVVCQNNCSGHGVCEQESRQCLCEAFWMHDLFRKYFGNGESNCDWSILYVVIGLAGGMVLGAGCVWGVACLCMKLCGARTPARGRSYKLLDSVDDGRLPLGKVNISESESDSDVLFESRRGGKTLNGVKAPRNGYKMVRVKT